MPTTRAWWWRVFALVTLLAGCAAPPYAKNDEVTALVQAYRQQSIRAAQTPSPGGIRALTVEPAGDTPGEFVVTADLERASLNVVVRRLLEQTRIPHLIIPQSLVGRVTGRFEKHPFAQVLRQLLDAHGYVATVQDGLTVITEGGRPPAVPAPPAGGTAPASGTAPDAPAPPLSRAVQLRHLDMESATKFLEGLFPVDQRTGARPISWAVQPYTSTVFVSGPGPEIARAVRLLDEMDRDPTHVMIEVLIVELDTNELERLGADLVNFMQDKFSQLSTGIGGVNVVPGVGAAPAALRFLFTQTQDNRRQFETVIDVLAQQDKARIIARPYMAASSGKQAAIQIQRERTVAVVAGAGGQVTSDTETIPSGVILTITPWVVEDERVRLDVQVEQSNFLENLSPGVLVEKDANKAQTSMHVRSGQSVVIGGLALQETSSSNSGLPWLRHLPLVNLLASKQRGTERKQDVIVFVTPYVWTPAVDPPFPSPEAFKFQEIDELTALEQWKRRFIRP